MLKSTNFLPCRKVARPIPNHQAWLGLHHLALDQFCPAFVKQVCPICLAVYQLRQQGTPTRVLDSLVLNVPSSMLWGCVEKVLTSSESLGLHMIP